MLDKNKAQAIVAGTFRLLVIPRHWVIPPKDSVRYCAATLAMMEGYTRSRFNPPPGVISRMR